MKLTLVVAAVLAASLADARVPIHGKGKCDASRVQMFVGALGTADVGTAILRLSKSRALRWLPPGVMTAQDYRTDRLDVRLDERNYILALTCG